MIKHRRIRGVDKFTPFWYIWGFPYDLLHLVVIFLNPKRSFTDKKQDNKQYWYVKKNINVIRKQCKALRVVEKIYTTNTLLGIRLQPTTKKEIVKVYYRYKRDTIFIKFRFHGTVVQSNDYEKFVDACATLTGLKTTPLFINPKNRFAYFDLFEPTVAISQVVCDKEKYAISIGTNSQGMAMWHYNDYPHALIVGDTGSGKSNLLNYMFLSLSDMKHVWVLNGKRVGFGAMKKNFERYMVNKNNIDECMTFINDFCNVMEERYEYMETKDVEEYYELGLEPYFLFIDEYIRLIDSIRTKSIKDELKFMIGDIARAGRSAGMFLVLVLQRPDTIYIDGNAREQFHLKVVLGDAKKNNYEMAFEMNDLQPFKEEISGKGKAWYALGSKIDALSIPNYKDVLANLKGSK